MRGRPVRPELEMDLARGKGGVPRDITPGFGDHRIGGVTAAEISAGGFRIGPQYPGNRAIRSYSDAVSAALPFPAYGICAES